MLRKNEQERIYDEILRESEWDLRSNETTVPRFVSSAEREAKRRGVSVGELLRQQTERLRASDYPGPDCLDPDDVEQAVLKGLTPVQQNHLGNCQYCATLVALSSQEADPPGVPVGRFGAGLLDQIQALEGRNDRRTALRKVFDQFCASNYHEQIAERLIRLAHVDSWPTWAIECLPSLCITMSPSQDQTGRVLLWRYLAECVPNRDEVVVNSTLCDGLVLDASVGTVNKRWIEAFAPVFEKSRLGNPFPSVESMVGIVLDTIREVENLTESPGKLAGLQEARSRVFRSLFKVVIEMTPEARPELTQQAKDNDNPQWVKAALKGVA
jgi:hypothetical protein